MYNIKNLKKQKSLLSKKTYFFFEEFFAVDSGSYKKK